MSKLFTSLLTGLCLFCCQLAAQPTFTINPPITNANVNDTISFDVTVSDFNDIISLQLSVDWLPEVLSYGWLSNINSTALPGLNINQFGTPEVPNIDDGDLTLTWFDDTFSGVNLSDGTVLFTINLIAVADGTTFISIGGTPTAIEVVNTSFVDIGLNFQAPGAQVIIGDGGGGITPTVELEAVDQTVVSGSQVCVPVTVSSFLDIDNFQFSLGYNTADLTFNSIQNINPNIDGLSSNNFSFPGNGTTAGSIAVDWDSGVNAAESLSDGSTLFEVCFTANAASGNTTVSFAETPTPTVIEDTDGNTLDFQLSSSTVSILSNTGNEEDFKLTIFNTIGTVGDEVCVQVSVDGFLEIVGMQFSINYDPSQLQFISVGGFNLPDLNGNLFGTPLTGTNPGDITLSWFDNSLNGVTMPDGAVIFEVCFIPLTAGSFPVSFSGNPTSIEISDESGGTIPFNSQSGMINVTEDNNSGVDGFALIASNEIVSAGQEVCVQVSVQEFVDILGLQFSMNYNPAVLQFIAIDNINLTGLATNQFGTPLNGTSPGDITLSWFDNSLGGVTLPDGVAIFEVCFLALSEASTTFSFSGSPTAIEISEVPGNIIDYDNVSGTISIGEGTNSAMDLGIDVYDINGNVGDQICVPVAIRNFNNIKTLELSLNYDPLVMDFVSVSGFNLENLSSANFETPLNEQEAGNIILSWNDLDGSGVSLPDEAVIFEVCFQLIGLPGSASVVEVTGAPNPIRVVNVADENINIFDTDGEVNINTTPGSVVFEISDAQVLPNEIFCLELTANDFDNLLGIQYTITYDPDKLLFESISNISLQDLTVDQFGLPGPGGTAPGRITMTWFDNSLSGVTLPDGSMLYEVCFKAIGDCASNAYVNFYSVPTAVEISNVANQVLPFSGLAGNVKICSEDQVAISNAVVTDATCNNPDGAIDLIVQGGSGCYEYLWSNDATDEDLTGVPGGTYSVTVTDCSTGFTATNIYTVEAPGALTINPNAVGVTCNGESDGSINLLVTGGTPVYTYNWADLPDGETQFDDLSGGSYPLTITDNGGCEVQLEIIVPEPDPVVASLSAQNITVGNDGRANNEVSGGTAPYTFSWEGPDGFTSNLQQVVGLGVPGQYCVTIVDNNNCTTTGCVFVSSGISLSAEISDACEGDMSGSIDLTPSGQDTDFTFNWSGPGDFTSSEEDLFNLTPGTYNVTVTDGVGQSAGGTFVVNIFPEMVIDATVTPVLGPPGSTNGAIEIDDNDGDYSFLWDNGSNSPNRVGLAADTYCVTITNVSNGCEVDTCFNVFLPFGFAGASTEDVSCNGFSDGQIQIDFAGGAGPYTATYAGSSSGSINADNSPLMIPELMPGNYSVTLTDQLGNELTLPGPFTIVEPASLAVDPGGLQIVHDSEGAGCTGSISLLVTGGVSPYTVEWDSGGVGASITNLCAGCYTPTVTDANGCETQFSDCIEITEFGVASSLEDVSCPEDEDGSIDLTVTGGEPDYTFTWSHGPTTEDVSDLTPGDYSVTIEEGSGNTLVRNFTINVTSNLSYTLDIQSNYNGFAVRCADSADGRVVAQATGGEGRYEYEWTNAAGEVVDTDAVLENAEVGIYELFIIDGSGCTISAEDIVLNAPEAIDVQANIVDITCVGEEDGEIAATASGGLFGLPYTYAWNTGSIGPRLTFLESGVYRVSVTDGNNCISENEFIVQQPDTLEATVVTEPATDGCNGTARVEVRGGTSPYNYLWNGDLNLNTAMLVDLCPGDYFVQVTDSQDCPLFTPDGQVSGRVLEQRGDCFDTRAIITPDGDGLNEEFIISCIEEFKDNRLLVFNRWGRLVFETRNYDNTWRGRDQNGELLPDGAYYFVIEYSDNNGNQIQEKGSVTILNE